LALSLIHFSFCQPENRLANVTRSEFLPEKYIWQRSRLTAITARKHQDFSIMDRSGWSGGSGDFAIRLPVEVRQPGQFAAS